MTAALYAILWLVRDTFRQALASGIFWVLATVSAMAILFCLSVSVEGGQNLSDTGDKYTPMFLPADAKAKIDPDRLMRTKTRVVEGNLYLAFGAVPIPLSRDARFAVRFIQVALGFGVADALGIILILIWTSGFLPSFLEPSAAAVLLAKPVPRWSLLAGKYLGVIAFVATMALLFVGGTWLALGLKTGIWDMLYLLCIPLLLFHFAIFYSFSALLAVLTRSTVACVFGSLVFWIMCWGLNFGRHAAVTLPELNTMAPAFQCLLAVGYWILPKPGDMSMVLFDSLNAKGFIGQSPQFVEVQKMGLFHPELSALSSLAFTVVMLFLAGYEFVSQDY